MGGRVAFFRRGSFSHINASVERFLGEAFDGWPVDVHDLEGDLLRRRAGLRLATAAAACREYRGDLLARRRTFSACRLRTAFLDRVARRWAGRVAGRGAYTFSFQTSSLLDFSVPGLPHFVYTDHAHLANLSYPHFDPADLFPPRWIARERAIYGHAELVFTMSGHVRRSLIAHYRLPPESVHRVFAGSNADYDYSAAAAAPPPDYGAGNILFVGVDWERKGGPELLEAFGAVRREHPHATLTVVGCSPRTDRPGVRVAGRVPLGEVGRFFRAASVFCLPSRIEPFGIVFLEACGHRLPVVSTTVGALPEIVLEGRSGHLVPPGDPAALAAALGSLIGSPGRCRAFGQAGFEHVRETYSWPAVGTRVGRLIRGALDGIDGAGGRAPQRRPRGHP